MAVSDYSTTPDQNTTISGINIAEGCPPSGINNAIRQLMSDVKESDDEKLPKTGGTMTGTITAGTSTVIRRGVDNSSVDVYGDTKTDGKGSYLSLRGCSRESYAGEFVLRAGDGTNVSTLTGSPSGTLKWTGKDVTLKGDCLPISGGTLTGSIKCVNEAILADDNTSYVRVNGGAEYGNGASILLTGKSFDGYNGRWVISADNGTNNASLNGWPDGRLYWNGHKVATVDGFTMENGSVINMGGTGTYLRVHGGTGSQDGAGVYLYGGTNSSGTGKFIVRAAAGGTYVDLTGTKAGSLSWGGKEILRLGNISSYITFKTVSGGSTMTIPSGGTWSWCWWSVGGTNAGSGSYSGGSSWKNTSSVTVAGFCIRTA